MCERESVCVRERECVSVFVRMCMCERECVCVCVCVWLLLHMALLGLTCCPVRNCWSFLMSTRASAMRSGSL